MAVLSDLLGFPHHTCARGSTVDRPFLEDLATALGVPNPQRLRNKDQLLLAAARAATGREPDALRLLSSGGTVTDEALDTIIDGVLAYGPPPVDAVAARVAADLQAAQHDDADAAFDALDLSDERIFSLRGVVDRPRQQRFRNAVLGAYPGCAVTGCLDAAVLDAAHIRPYRGPRTNSVRNGICLRADLHRLWDRGLLAVHERTLEVRVRPQVLDTAYRALDGARISLPADPDKWPDPTALRLQREWCGL